MLSYCSVVCVRLLFWGGRNAHGVAYSATVEDAEEGRK